MTYRLSTQVRPLIWIECSLERHGKSRIEYVVKCKSNYKRKSTANNVEIVMPVPADVDSPDFKTSIGKVDYVPEKDNIVWKIKQLQGMLGVNEINVSCPT
jgi:AP-1 complex subunit mu